MGAAVAWTTRTLFQRPDSIPQSPDPFIEPKRRQAHAHWVRVARQLPRRARVLEIGAGSCIVSRWMIAHRPDLVIIASDCGNYPVDRSGIRRISFMPETPIETLPFPDGSFDAVVSQFAFEYAIRDQAIAQCGRVLRAGGRLSFLMHARGGALHDACALRVAGAQMILQAPSIVELLDKADKIANPDLRSSMYQLVLAPQLTDRLIRLGEMEITAGITLPGLRGFLDGALHHIRRFDFSEWFAEARSEFHTGLFVGQDQLRAALDPEAVDHLSRLAQSHGLDPAPASLSEIAWEWTASKPAEGLGRPTGAKRDSG